MSMTSLKAPVQASGQPVQCRLWERPSSAKKASHKKHIVRLPMANIAVTVDSKSRDQVHAQDDEKLWWCAADDERHDHGVRCHEEWCVNAVWESWPMREENNEDCVGCIGEKDIKVTDTVAIQQGGGE
jgi:hypothetical protein